MSYIGQTITPLADRIAKHFCTRYGYFPNALRKYGKDNFSFEVLVNATSKEMLNSGEIFFIDRYNTKWPNGYNLTDGGNGGNGYIPSDETREKMRKAKLGRKIIFSKEHRENLSKALMGKKPSEQHRENLRKSHLGQVAWNKGLFLSEETKRKLSESHLGKPWTEEQRRNRSSVFPFRKIEA
jgi:group I intron endonuclease